MAYELCTASTQQTSNAATISALVLKCKKAKWDIRERERRPVQLEDVPRRAASESSAGPVFPVPGSVWGILPWDVARTGQLVVHRTNA